MQYLINSFNFLMRSDDIVISSNKQQLVRTLTAPRGADYPAITNCQETILRSRNWKYAQCSLFYQSRYFTLFLNHLWFL